MNILVAMWDGGGTVPPELAIVKALVQRGHDVRVIGDAVLADEVAATGASHTPWVTAPQHHSRLPEDDFLRDWELTSMPKVFARVRDRLFCGPAALFAADVLDELGSRPVEVLVTSQMLLGAQIGGEAARVPVVMLCSNVYAIPGTGQPPFGTGFQPARSPLGRARDRLIGAVMERMFDGGLDAINAARTTNGLDPLRHTLDQMRRQHTLLLIDEKFDFPARFPDHVQYAGAQLDDPDWVETWSPPVGPQPLVLVAMSGTYQRQDAVLAAAATALGTLPVRGIVTTGLTIDPSTIPAPPNVAVVRSAPHSTVLRHAAAVITHGGHGTVAKTLAAGVPMLVLPMGRDQADNAARVVAGGAGLRQKPTASPQQLARTVRRLLEDPSFRANAQELGAHIRTTSGPSVAVRMIEQRASLAPTR
jgi:MGT family glycosyltransferase